MKKSFLTLGTIMLVTGISGSLFVYSQTNVPVQKEKHQSQWVRCGQVEYENYLRSKDPNYDLKKKEAMKKIAEKVKEIEMAKLNGNPQPFTSYTIPIVVHVVYRTASENVTDAKVQAMIAQLNMDWSRTNTDAGNTPSVWQSIAANMEVQFCLATKDPSGGPTNGIVHKQTSTTQFGIGDVQSSSTGGDDPWNVNQYLNIWSCNLGSGLLGYGQFPPISSSYGTAIHYCTVGSMTSPGTCPPYDIGRTLSHEIGHCFSLYHIWGDDGGACSGSDQVSDTPNQADATSGCPAFPKTDACTGTSPGIMFMNYMDYSNDACYNMFTAGQKTRVQTAISSYLMSIANNAATVCAPAAALDAGISTIVSPNSLACNTTFTPVVTLTNYGANTLTSCTINYKIDANPNQVYNWSGSLATGISTNVTLPSMTTTAGTHTFTCSTSNPNAGTDGNPANDQSTSTFTISSAQNPPIVEGMESATFPPTGWTLNNPDVSTTWARTTAAAKTGSASMYMDNYDYSANGQVDELTLPPLNLQFFGNPTLTFQIAYQLYTDPAANPNWSDTLKVQTSTDCGVTWSTPYFKYSTQLTTATPVFSTTEFAPTASQWRLETVSLPNAANVLVKFRHTTDYENNLYIDDINITGTGNPGVNELDLDNLVTIYPNPSSGNIFVYINTPGVGKVNVKIYNIVGEVISETTTSAASKKVQFNFINQPNGVYFIEVKSENRKTVKKLVLSK